MTCKTTSDQLRFAIVADRRGEQDLVGDVSDVDERPSTSQRNRAGETRRFRPFFRVAEGQCATPATINFAVQYDGGYRYRVTSDDDGRLRLLNPLADTNVFKDIIRL